MRMSVCRWCVVVSFVALGVVAAPSTANAQYRPSTSFADAAIGEDYRIEAGYGWGNAEPSLIVNSESLGLPGTDIDLITDLGIEQHKLGTFDLVLRAGRKHRFKYQRLPIKYETDAFQVSREF